MATKRLPQRQKHKPGFLFMWPVLFTIPIPRVLVTLLDRWGLDVAETFAVHTYGVLGVLGFLVALYVIGRENRLRGGDPDKLIELIMGSVLSGFIGARLLFVILEWNLYAIQPLEILNIRDGGLVFQGGLVGALCFALYFIYQNGMDLRRTVDTLVVGLPIGHMLGRVGCLSAGCCYGTPTKMPWGITFSDPARAGATLDVPLHPVQIYEAVGNLAIFVVLLYVIRRRLRFDGQVALLYFILYPLLRFLIEFYRGDLARGFFLEAEWGFPLSTAQAFTLVEVPIALTLLVLLYRRAPVDHPEGDG